MQLSRITMTESTAWDCSYGLPMIIGLFIVVLVPRSKVALAEENEPPVSSSQQLAGRGKR